MEEKYSLYIIDDESNDDSNLWRKGTLLKYGYIAEVPEI